MMTYALSQINEEYVHISAAEKGNAYVCALCLASLFVVKGEVNRHHFRHKKGSRTKARGGETKLHEMAKEYFKSVKTMKLPNGEVIQFDRVDDERSLEGKVKPDVIGYVGKRLYAIEICVTHAVDTVKIAKLEKLNLDAIEIDLSQWHRSCPSLSGSAGLELLLTKHAPRKWVARRKRFPKLWRIWRQWVQILQCMAGNGTDRAENSTAPIQLKFNF